MQKERKLVNDIEKYIKSIGGYFIKTSDKFTSGIPDLIIFYKKRTIFVEVKTYDGDLEPIQEYTMHMINKYGGEAYIVRNIEILKNILDN